MRTVPGNLGTSFLVMPRAFGLSAALGRVGSPTVFLWFIMATVILGVVGRSEVFGFRLCGWAWIAALLVACGRLCVAPVHSRRFPLELWLPFFVYILLRSESFDRAELQRIGIILAPLAVAGAASLSPLDSVSTLRMFYHTLFAISGMIYVVSVALTRSIYGEPFFIAAGAAMTWTITALFAAVEIQNRSRIAWVVLMLSYGLCVVTKARMPMLVIPLIFLFGPTGMSFRSRFIWGILAAVVVPIIFYTPLIQSYVFRHGQTGTIADTLTLDPALVNSAGRLTMWPQYLDAIHDVWLGEGSTASVELGNELSGGGWSHPHNDYIRILFDYGIIGVMLLAVPTVWVLWECIRGLGSTDIKVVYMYRIACCGILSMLLLGITGNAIMYSTWIGNPIFATLGVAFAERRRGMVFSRSDVCAWAPQSSRVLSRARSSGAHRL